MSTPPELTLDATWGGSTANCYITHADDTTTDPLTPGADSLVRFHIQDVAAWEVAGIEQRQRALLEATRLIDAQNWLGSKIFIEQLLEFPRAQSLGWSESVRTDPAYLTWLETDVYLRQQRLHVRKAVCIQAAYLLSRPFDRSRDEQYRGIRGSSSGTRLSQSSGYADVHMDLAPAVWDELGSYKGARRLIRGNVSG